MGAGFRERPVSAVLSASRDNFNKDRLMANRLSEWPQTLVGS